MAMEGAVCTADVIRKCAAVWPSLERAAVASRKGLKGLARDGRDIQRAAGVGRSAGATLAAHTRTIICMATFAEMIIAPNFVPPRAST
jgi:hypothetical protein